MDNSSTNPNSSPESRITWHAIETNEVIHRLQTTISSGLTIQEAERRLEQYGPNQLQEAPRPTFLKMLVDQLNNFVVILLIVASVISAALGDWIEAIAIMAIVVLNAVLGVIQESRAEQALAALKKLAAPDAQVLRDGKRQVVSALQLVPGDLVFVEAGNYIPADLRLVEVVNLQVDEAPLTGESVPVQKNAALMLQADIPLGDQKNSAFMGTLVTYGRGKGIVTGTGMSTQLGLIATMLQSVEMEETPLQKRLYQLGKILGIAAIAICAVVFLVGLIRTDWSMQAVIDNFMVAVSLAIAAVPEGLPAIVTISLALGMREMVRRHALIRKLASVETLGSATVICSDKTGTLTQNEMTVTRIWAGGKTFEVTGSGYSPEGEVRLAEKTVDLQDYPAARTALWVGLVNNDAELEFGSENGTLRMVGDPTEGALLVAAAKAGASISDLLNAYPRKQEIPFDSVRKRMVTLHAVVTPLDEDISPIYGTEKRGWYAVAVKGAPDEILKLCSAVQSADDRSTTLLTEERRNEILAVNDEMTQGALRVLGLAYKILPNYPEEISPAILEKDLVFCGLVGMIDPPRVEVKPALERAKTAGIRTIMITGDFSNTARAIAESIGLLQSDHQVKTGGDIEDLSPDAMRQVVQVTDVYARVSPEHKMKIVEALRANGEVVAMTGDGVNDAPAIKMADIGVAMGITGTDVAKGTADMVLMDDNYVTIVSAVEQGRVIYSNIRKFVYYLLSCNMAEIATIFIATLAGWGSPLTPIQLLWLNLVTDGAPALALGTEKGDPDIMQQPPRPPKEPIINRFMQLGIVIQTIAITAVTLGAFYIGRYTDPIHVEYAETMAFVTLSISELIRAFTARSEYYPLIKTGIFGNRLMNLAVISSLVLILVVVYVPFFNTVFDTLPLTWTQWVEIFPLIFIPSVAAEFTKFLFSPMKKQYSQFMADQR